MREIDHGVQIYLHGLRQEILMCVFMYITMIQ